MRNSSYTDNLKIDGAIKPVSNKERIELLDALRGFAVCGILLANMPIFMGYFYLNAQQQAALPFAAADKATMLLIHFFIEGKFYSIFSLLFGIGFAVQLLRAEAKGSPFLPHYMRRLSVLFLIGMAHMLLLWTGDILAAYALMGFVLLLFRHKSNRSLLIWAVVLLCLPVLQYALVLAMGGKIQPGMLFTIGASILREQLGLSDERLSQLRGDYVTMVKSNIVSACYRFNNLLYTGRFFKVLAMFLVGFYVGRKQFFKNPQAHRNLSKKILYWGLCLGVPANILLTWLTELGNDSPPSLLGLAQSVMYAIGVVPLSLAYIAIFTLAWQKPFYTKWLQLFIPLGKMALTNYLLQTMICTIIFNGIGFGLIGKIGPFYGIGIIVLILLFQLLLSHWWMSHFRFGPIEWIWRSLTYGKLQKIRQAPVA